ncbi:MAG: NADH-quinone oxidoreductase subunit C [Acidocella sp.]|nr:NADH-quinone oxidoreductase subunit C [Acidocella sp.]
MPTPEVAVVVDPQRDAASALPGITAAMRALGELVVTTTPDAALNLLAHLRDEHGYEQVMDICAVDWPERPVRFDLVYNLLCLTRNERLRVICPIADGAIANSVSALWPCATWWEREVWDLFGIGFHGLADHRRLLTDYGFEGHPLRKDFPLTGYVEVHYDDDRKAVVYDKVKLVQEFRNFDFLSPWEGMTTLPGDEKARVRK